MPRSPLFRLFDVSLAVSDVLRLTPTTLSVHCLLNVITKLVKRHYRILVVPAVPVHSIGTISLLYLITYMVFIKCCSVVYVIIESLT